MKDNHFFAMLSRMKYINRWGLMINSREQNDCEHSLEVAYIAHALGIINNKIYNGSLAAERLAVLGMFHDVTEIVTGDMPTPVKYYSDEITAAYKNIEKVARDQLLTGLPEVLRNSYKPLFLETDEEQELWKYVKAADKISAYIKCLEERRAGNTDFMEAEKTIGQYIKDMHIREVDYFMKEFIPAYMKTLDELG